MLSLGPYLDHFGAIFGCMMDFTDNKSDQKWQIIDFHRFYTLAMCPKLLRMTFMGKNPTGAGLTMGLIPMKAIFGSLGHMAKV